MRQSALVNVARSCSGAVSSYLAGARSVPFLAHVACDTPDTDAKRQRLKVALFLQGSASFDVAAVKQDLESRSDILGFECAILDGKVKSLCARVTHTGSCDTARSTPLGTRDVSDAIARRVVRRGVLLAERDCHSPAPCDYGGRSRRAAGVGGACDRPEIKTSNAARTE